MKKLKVINLIMILILILFSFVGEKCYSLDYTTENMKVFESDNHKYFGLKNENDEVVIKPTFKKLIRLGKTSWIAQKKNGKFGLIDCEGNVLVPLKYVHAERLFDKWVKLGNERDYGIYDEFGKVIVPPKFVSIEPLFGMKFLTYRRYKYGVYNSDGEEILANKYDFIYMPDFKTMRIKYKGKWYDVEQSPKEAFIELPDIIEEEKKEDSLFSKVVVNTGIGAGYGIVTATDYTLKIFSSVSDAYEDTIDELMLSKGVETVDILMKFSWIPKFPAVYFKKYWNNLFEPDSGPLSGIRNDLIEQMK